MNRILLLILACGFLSCPGSLLAQTRGKGKVVNDYFDISFGKRLQLDKDFSPSALVARPHGGYLIQSFGKGEKEMGIDVVTEDFGQKASQVHHIRDGAPRANDHLVYFGGKAIWLNSNYSSNNRDEKAYIREIDDDNGTFSREEILINETSDVAGGIQTTFSFTVGGGASVSIFNTEKYFCSISPDSTKMLVYYRKKPVKKLDKQNKDVWGFVVVDESFRVLWNKEVEMPQTEFMMKFYEAAVSNGGTVYFLAKVYKDENRKYSKGAKPNYRLSLFELIRDTKKAKEKAMDMNEGFVRDADFFLTDAGEAVVCGTYSKIYKGDGSSGIFYNIVDPSGRKSPEFSHLEFDTDLDADYEGPKHAKRLQKRYKKYGDGYIPYVQLRKVFYNEKKKSLVMLLESYHLVITTQNRTTTYNYYYDDIYAVNVNTKRQQIDKSVKIPKRQYGRNVRVDLGVAGFMFEDELYVFFIDNKKNLEIKPDLVPEMHLSTAGGFLAGVMVNMGNSEEAARFLLFDSKVEKKYCDPERFIQSGGVIYGIAYEKPKGGGPYYPMKIGFK